MQNAVYKRFIRFLRHFLARVELENSKDFVWGWLDYVVSKLVGF